MLHIFNAIVASSPMLHFESFPLFSLLPHFLYTSSRTSERETTHIIVIQNNFTLNGICNGLIGVLSMNLIFIAVNRRSERKMNLLTSIALFHTQFFIKIYFLHRTSCSTVHFCLYKINMTSWVCEKCEIVLIVLCK
jgi:hypothetical protein